MRNIIFIVFAVLLLNACSKDSVGIDNEEPMVLSGKWNFTAYWYSTGGPGQWQTINPVTQWVQLNADGSCSSNIDPFKYTQTWQADSTIIRFVSTDASRNKSYYYKFTNGRTIDLSPVYPLCIEGCASRFSKN